MRDNVTLEYQSSSSATVGFSAGLGETEPTTIEIDGQNDQSPIDQYDLDDGGYISREEAMRAFNCHVFGHRCVDDRLTHSEIHTVAIEYLFSVS